MPVALAAAVRAAVPERVVAGVAIVEEVAAGMAAAVAAAPITAGKTRF
jgi:hypothetical protein